MYYYLDIKLRIILSKSNNISDFIIIAKLLGTDNNGLIKSVFSSKCSKILFPSSNLRKRNL